MTEWLVLFLAVLDLNQRLLNLSARVTSLEASQPASYVVRDANGVELGPVISIMDNGAWVKTILRNTDGRLFAFSVTRETLFGNTESEGNVYFQWPRMHRDGLHSRRHAR